LNLKETIEFGERQKSLAENREIKYRANRLRESNFDILLESRHYRKKDGIMEECPDIICCCFTCCWSRRFLSFCSCTVFFPSLIMPMPLPRNRIFRNTSVIWG